MEIQEHIENNPFLYVDYSPIATSGSAAQIVIVSYNPRSYYFSGLDNDTPCSFVRCLSNIISDATGQITEFKPVEELLKSSADLTKAVKEAIPINEHDQSLVDNMVEGEHRKALRKPFPK